MFVEAAEPATPPAYEFDVELTCFVSRILIFLTDTTGVSVVSLIFNVLSAFPISPPIEYPPPTAVLDVIVPVSALPPLIVQVPLTYPANSPPFWTLYSSILFAVQFSNSTCRFVEVAPFTGESDFPMKAPQWFILFVESLVFFPAVKFLTWQLINFIDIFLVELLIYPITAAPWSA